jgi:two-component system response regulator PilR (NtrC family)
MQLVYKTRSDKNLSSSDSKLLGESKVMQQLKQQIVKVARSQAPVLIYGESGTGKELVAREIHRLGPRSDKPFIAVNCGAIPAELMESEFFGHKKGSFTGAISDKEGLFRAAEGGTLFLDEVAELPITMQVKLLRAIQERAVKPVGGHDEIRVDVRLLSATHKNLQKEVEEERFRLDLFYRLNVIALNLPPLRERLDDIEILSKHLLKKISRESGEVQINPNALDKLKNNAFPGNVRELENILERAFAFCEDSTITAYDIQFENQIELSSPDSANSNRSSAFEVNTVNEKDELVQILEETHWNRTEAAKKLGMTLRQIRYRISKFGLDK